MTDSEATNTDIVIFEKKEELTVMQTVMLNQLKRDRFPIAPIVFEGVKNQEKEFGFLHSKCHKLGPEYFGKQIIKLKVGEYNSYYCPPCDFLFGYLDDYEIIEFKKDNNSKNGVILNIINPPYNYRYSEYKFKDIESVTGYWMSLDELELHQREYILILNKIYSWKQKLLDKKERNGEKDLNLIAECKKLKKRFHESFEDIIKAKIEQ